MAQLVLDGRGLTIGRLAEAARSRARIAIAAEVWPRLDAARAVVERYAQGDVPVYGLNTGLGGNLGHRLGPDAIADFQAQLIRGRAVAVGPPLATEVVRAGLIARANGIANGASGVSREVLEMLVQLVARGITPLVPSRGAIGAADLVLLAHVGLVMLGEGEAELEGERLGGGEALARAGLAPLRLGPKDGLGLINANAITAGHAALVLTLTRRLLRDGLAIAGLACEGYAANPGAFDPRAMALRPAPGQTEAAAALRALLAGSGLAGAGAPRAIQDALSFRCLPQIAGAALDALGRAVAVTETELNAAADNPAVLADEGEIVSNGNFHLAALALAFDALAPALAQLAHASAARIVKLMSAAHSGLPRYLSPQGGASAGLVPLQKAMAALLAEIRGKANPAGLDALAISDAVEDHAPQAPLAVRKLEEQLALFARLLAIEALSAAQAVDLRRLPRLGAGTRTVHAFVRERVATLTTDRPIGAQAERLALALLGGELGRALDPVVRL